MECVPTIIVEKNRLDGPSAEQESCFPPCPRSRLRIWSPETSSAVPSPMSALVLHTPRLNLALTHGIPPASFPRRHPLASVYRQLPSDQSRVYQITHLCTKRVDGRGSAGTGSAPVVLNVLRVKGVRLPFQDSPWTNVCATLFSQIHQ